jgi:ABC-type antimicrobial peptide transport system permease subunit
VEEVLGDLEEKFYLTIKTKSPFKARVNYWCQVFHYMRPFAIRQVSSNRLNQYAMFRNYFKVGFRNLRTNKGYSFINIGGFAMGMAITMLIGLWIYDELSYNKYHENYHDLVQVLQHQTFNGSVNTGSAIPRPLENALRDTYGSDFKYLSMASWTGDRILAVGEKKLTKSGNYFQADFPEMLTLKMIKGTRNGLKDPASILLSESTAKALFGDDNPMNQSVRIDNKMDVKVTGVYEDLPYNTSFNNLQFISSWELFVTSQEWVKNAAAQWGNNSFQLFAQLPSQADHHSVSEKIKKIKADNDVDERTLQPEIFLSPMKNWHLRTEWREGKNVGGRIQMVWLFGIIGAFVLMLACINFMNLSTARSEKRAKEVGIRMAIGSVRSQLINQFLSESFIVVVFSFVLALIIVVIALPMFNELADKRIFIEWSNPFFWLISVSFVLVTSLLAGSYPAIYLSSFQPVKVLKGAFRLGRFASLPRKVLVVVQFTVSVALVIGTIIVYQQIQFSKNRPTGYNRDGLIMILMTTPEFYRKFDVLRSELKNAGAIEEMSESSSPITDVWANSGGFNWPGKDPALQTDFATIRITHEYGKTVNWRIKEGRDMSREFATDSVGIILNEAAVKFMGVKNPVGMEITWDEEKLHIIGVVEDMITQSPYEPVKQTVYVLNYNNVNWINLKLSPAKSTSESLALVESVFKKHIPSAPFEYKFVDAEYARKFSAEERIGKLTSIFSLLAALISGLGIFGLASFVAEQRTKEVGIRKVLGASVVNLWRMLSTDFVLLVVISCAIAIPLSCYALRDWLKGYEYHTEISWWIPLVVSLGALCLTLFTVSFQAVKAALMNPVKSLRSE